MDGWASGLLIAALFLFLLSTRQFALWVRACILLGAIAALVGAGVIVATMEGHYGLFRMIADAWAHLGDFQNSVLATALHRNEASIDRNILPLLDLFLIVAALLGLVAIVALTPGETIERIVRPGVFVLIGVMLGATFALSVVAIGFGGPVDPRGYAGVVRDADVHDGDTFWMGETSLRLFGVEAPERNQTCVGGAQCGALARQYLADQLAGALLECEARTGRNNRVTETFGRPLVQCRARLPSGEHFDVGQRMIESGHATLYADSHPLEYERLSIDARRRDVLAQCWLDPRSWRRDRGAKERFLREDLSDLPLVGSACAYATDSL